jgi:protein-S-isoprenylcysteine O-methyltransferase Ste14
MSILLIIQIVAFALGIIFIIHISKRSLRSLKYHGFYKFFVFEFTLVLLLLNIPHWFDYPFSLQQIVSWISLAVSILFVVLSFYFFAQYGGSKKKRDNTANLGFENTVSLIQDGIYKYTRHPMYGSLLLLAFGAMFKYITVLTVSLAIVTLIFIIFTAKTEERENIKFFGSDYEDYMKKTKMFIPFVI